MLRKFFQRRFHTKRTTRFFTRKTKRLYRVVPAIEATKVWKTSDVKGQFIDLRNPSEVENMFIDKFQNIPLSKLKEKTNDIPKNLDIYLLCRSSHKSTQAAQVLESAGYSQVVVIDGGLLHWLYASPVSVQGNDPSLKEMRQNILSLTESEARPALADLNEIYNKYLIEQKEEKLPYREDDKDPGFLETIFVDPPGIKHDNI